MSNPPCPAALNLLGEHFPCDWPTDEDGNHDGWGHANQDAQAIWTGPATVLPQPSTFQLLPPTEKNTTWDIWSEGYAANEGRSGALRLASNVQADTFLEAVRSWVEIGGQPRLFDEEKMTYWGCRLFDNERDAQESFG